MTLHNGPTPDLEEPCPTRWSYFYDKRFCEFPWNMFILEQLEQSKYRCSRYIRPAYQAICDTVEIEITNALKGIKSPEDAMKDAAEKCDEIVDKEYEKYGGEYPEAWADGVITGKIIDKITDIQKWIVENSSEESLSWYYWLKGG
jgi:hypothetical protein